MADRHSILVYGAGAVGGYLGGRLALLPGVQVTLLGRPAKVEAVRARGLVIREGGRTIISHPRAVDTTAGLEAADLIIVTVRTFDLPVVAVDVSRLAGKSGLVMAVQNGVGADEALSAALGTDRILPATLTTAVRVIEPGVVEVLSSGGLAVAAIDGRPILPWILRALDAAGLTPTVLADYRSLRWSKLLLSMLGAASSAICDMDLADLMRHPDIFRVEQLAFREAARTMDAARIAAVSLPGYPVPLARALMRLPRPLAQRLVGARVGRSRGGRSPGMRSDIVRGRAEADFFHGAIVREARRLGGATPVCEALAEILDRLTRHPDERATFRGNPAALIEALRARGIQFS